MKFALQNIALGVHSVSAWHGDEIQPKPSPTVMLYQIVHHTQEQQNSYKTTLFFKFYKRQKNNNFRRQLDKSLFWANELKKA